MTEIRIAFEIVIQDDGAATVQRIYPDGPVSDLQAEIQELRQQLGTSGRPITDDIRCEANYDQGFAKTYNFYYNGETGGIYVRDLDGSLLIRRKARNLFQGMETFFDYYGDDEVDAFNAEIHEQLKELYQQSRSAPVERRNFNCGFVYLLQGAEFYKIGMTRQPVAKRMIDITPRLPFESVLIHVIESNNAVELEKSLHQKFADKRARGEWFKLDQADIDWFIAGAK